jgi:glycosyltransferase involved in cell wall biosynthesis
MVPVSIVIITKNEADIIARCIDMARQITDDIVIIDNGSTDETVELAFTYGCRVYKKNWDGYGANKNKGIDAAKYNWILSIDADEIPDDDLIKAIHQLNFADNDVVYDIKFCSYFGDKLIRFGSWGRDHHVRLFNRNVVKWSETLVHEKLLLPANVGIKKIAGHIHHYSAKDIFEYDSKGIYYASLSAKKYFQNGKRTDGVKLYLSPLFGFIKNYILFLGFLDGRDGWDIATTISKHTKLKYRLLSELENTRRSKNKQPVNDSFAVEY